MKRFILLLMIMIMGTSLFAQQKTNLVFFTEQGERFTVILNGIRQNAQAETNVKITDLIAPTYKVKIIFEDAKLGEVDKTLTFNQGTETTFTVKKNNKGEYVIRWMNEVPIAESRPAPQGQTTVVYTTTPPPATGTVTHTQTTTTVTGENAPGSGNVNMGININDPSLGVNFNMNVSGGGVTSGGSTQTTTTYSTTTTTTSSSGGTPPPTQPVQQVYVLPGYNGPVGCPYPISSQDFASVKQSIASKSFEDSKLTIAKQVINTNCLLSSQVKEIMLLFSFEDTRLELAKYAYGYTFDIGNYYKLNDAFTFESSIEELNEYISSFRR
ncbi:MAG TPA: DUF4476 domain-containing protein [Bacteroidales bacterium]|nr:DUF4476 domain-containing protein [Bacteroidales bacterium]HSA43207.1 DUF4476 domain-containing protein [Bacteroidales bacterium]